MTARSLTLAALVATSALLAAVPATAAATADAAAPEASIEHDGDRLTLTAGRAQSISGEASLAAGESVEVRVASRSGSSGFIKSREATVARDGSFRALFDFSQASPGGTASVTVTHDGEKLASVTAEFVACERACEREDGEPSGDELALEPRASGPAGDVVRFIVGVGDARAATVSIGGTAVGYELNATVRDRDGDGRVTLAFDTSALDPDPSLLAVGSDSVETTSETDLPEQATRLAAGSYPVALYRGENASSTLIDEMELVLTEGSGEQYEDSQSGMNTGFASANWTVSAGATATLDVSVAAGENATVSVTGDRGAEATVVVRDGDGDGRVLVRLSTAVEDGALSASAVGSADTAAVTNASLPAEAVVDGALAPAGYDVSVYRGTPPENGPADVGTLYVSERRDQSSGDDGAGGVVGPVVLGVGGVLAAAGVALLAGARQ